MNEIKWALVVSPTPQAQEAGKKLEPLMDWVSVEDANQVVVLGGDGFMLQTLHQMLNRNLISRSTEIGRASCRERLYVTVGAEWLYTDKHVYTPTMSTI